MTEHEYEQYLAQFATAMIALKGQIKNLKTATFLVHQHAKSCVEGAENFPCKVEDRPGHALAKQRICDVERLLNSADANVKTAQDLLAEILQPTPKSEPRYTR